MRSSAAEYNWKREYLIIEKKIVKDSVLVQVLHVIQDVTNLFILTHLRFATHRATYTN